MPDRQVIYTLDALCGADKTYALSRLAHRYAKGGLKVALIQPSRHLIDATLRDELGGLDPVRTRVIHSDTHPGGVRGEIIAHMETTPAGGEIMLCTHAAWFALPYVPNRRDWIVIIDEIPTVDAYQDHNLPETHAILTKAITARPWDARYCILDPAEGGGKGHLDAIASNRARDDVWDILRPLAAKIASPHWDVFALDYQFVNLSLAKSSDRRRLVTYGLLNPSVLEGFARVIIGGACIRDSVMHHLWSDKGVVFRELKSVGLRYRTHHNGKRMTIHWGVEGSWSKALRDRDTSQGLISDRIVAATELLLENKPFVFMVNKDMSPFGGMPHAERLPNTPHGLNTYQDRHAAVVLSALNAPPLHFEFLKSKGLDAEAVRDAGMRQTIYQAVMRMSIRDPNASAPVDVVVPDSATAEWLRDLFPGSSLQRLAGFAGAKAPSAGRPKRHSDDAARQRASRKAKRLRLLADLDLINGMTCRRVEYRLTDTRDRTSNPMSRNPSIYKDNVTSETGYGSVFESIYDSTSDLELLFMQDDDFICELRGLAQMRQADKEDGWLISPATYDPNAVADTSRGLENITHVRGIWLDNDGGQLSKEEFARLFPRLRMVIYNTFRSTPAAERWRVFIPTTHAMPIAVYDGIQGAIFKILNAESFYSDKEIAKNPKLKGAKSHGFDMSKRTASSLFYLPCQAQQADASFFIDHNDDLRAPLDPYDWARCCIDLNDDEERPQRRVETVPKPLVDTKASPALRAMRSAIQAEATAPSTRLGMIEDAKRAWEIVRNDAGRGNEEFFIFASRLAAAGCRDTELRAELEAAALSARSPKQRRAEINRIVRKLSIR